MEKLLDVPVGKERSTLGALSFLETSFISSRRALSVSPPAVPEEASASIKLLSVVMFLSRIFITFAFVLVMLTFSILIFALSVFASLITI